MGLLPPPRAAAWRHLDARDGFEVAFFDVGDDGISVRGHDHGGRGGRGLGGRLRDRARPGLAHPDRGRHAAPAPAAIARPGSSSAPAGRWRVDGVERPDLDGILDVDLGSSSMTNAFPVRRLDLAIGESADGAGGVGARRSTSRWRRSTQSYERLTDEGDGQRFAYDSPAARLRARCSTTTADGLVRDYPGIAVRVA